MSRAFLFIMDSVGIGGAPDAAAYGDEGSNTLGHIAAACLAGSADRDGVRSGRLKLPNLERLGLGLAARLACTELPAGFDPDIAVEGLFASACEQSRGKDTPSGHWEIAGVPVDFEWGYFPRTEPCFPKSLTEAAIRQGELPGILGNKHASGTEIIAELGAAHIETGQPIFYTSADSVVQIAAHEKAFGLERLYRLCEIVRPLVDPLNIGRVIARPFVGDSAKDFARTGNRRDYSVPPPGKTLLDRVQENGGKVFAVGKIDDIFAHRGTTHVMKANGNDALFNTTLEAMAQAADGDLVVTNFIDFDQLYGHRRDVAGYAACLEHFDARLPELTAQLRKDDMMVLTADHGNDPTWPGTDHTREQVPALFSGPQIAAGDGGVRKSFADIGATIADHLGLARGRHGTSLLGKGG